MLVLTAAVLVTVVCVVRRKRKKLLTPQPEQPMYDYVGPPDLPPDRVQLKENIAYGNIKPPLSAGLPVTSLHGTAGDLLLTKENEQTETLQMKENEAYGETGMLQMNDGETGMLQMKENEVYEQTSK